MSGETWTVLKIIQWTTEYLEGKGIEHPRLDSEILLANLLKLDRVGLYLNFDKPLTKDELSLFRGIVKRRGSREPLQYITNRQEFWSLSFKVTPDVLIPRPETEILIEEAIKAIRSSEFGVQSLTDENSKLKIQNSQLILDLCTGSGCIAISLAHELKDSIVYATDASEAALKIAKKNAETNGVFERIKFLQGDLYTAIHPSSLTLHPFHLIVSNPPYVKSSDIPNIQPEVRDYEPRMALDGGPEGLDFYRKIISEAPDYLSLHGQICVEVGEGQSEAVKKIMADTNSFDCITAIKDLAGIERVVKARKK